MSLYSKYILPRFLDFNMKQEDMEQYRPSVIEKASGIVLEIGFGSGLNLPYYKKIEKFYAVDPSTELYARAQERIAKVGFPIQYFPVSAEKIPLADNTIDTVVSTWSLCSVSNPELVLKEIRRVLKPEGKFVFIEHGKSPRRIIAKWQKILTPISKCIAGGCCLDRSIDTLIINAGFEIIELEKFQQKNKSLDFMYKGVAVTRQDVSIGQHQHLKEEISKMNESNLNKFLWEIIAVIGCIVAPYLLWYFGLR